MAIFNSYVKLPEGILNHDRSMVQHTTFTILDPDRSSLGLLYGYGARGPAASK
jgi:hypothetical protein